MASATLRKISLRTFIRTIDKLVVETMGHGTEQETKPVLYCCKAIKGLVFNRTNAVSIASPYGDKSGAW